MPDPEVTQVTDALRSWDWRAELARQERDVPWLSRHSKISQRTLYRRWNGESEATHAELRAIATALGMAGPDGADL